MICKYCDREFKNKHGLHIHWFYCWIKQFVELQVEYIGAGEARKLMKSTFFIPIIMYHPKLFKFIKKNEFGMERGIRYVLKQ